MASARVGIRDFKNQASSYVERAERGETVIVTRRGVPVAQLLPAALPAGLERLIADGSVLWSGGKLKFPRPIRLRGDGPLASDIVREGRR